jgi:L-threonylcarbamoyladenylate synthase
MADKDFEVPVKLLQQGEAIAMPTETVYGLAANAFDGDAVKKIFEAKNRPSDNPLIVHVSSIDMLKTFVEEITPTAELLMKKFWPGPLTLLFKATGKVSPTVLAGQPTVAVRQPSHPVAQKLIALSGLPLAAPSANRSGRPSPTTAAHVMDDLKGRIPCIIDGGDSHVGVESTVVDVHRNPPLILRPGGVTLEQLRELVPSMEVYSKVVTGEDLALKPPTPGLKYKHYSPDAQVILFEGPSPALAIKLAEQMKELLSEQKRVGYIHTRPNTVKLPQDLLANRLLTVSQIGSEDDLGAVARGLFKSLRELDELGVEVILVEGITEEHEGLAVMNRIRKAASHIVHAQ